SSGVDTDHDITFTSGKYIGSDRVYDLPAYTKQFDAAFAEGTNAGGLGDGVSLPTSGAFYVFAISKDSSPSTVDFYGDTDSGGANVPTGWTILFERVRYMTNSSGNLYKTTGRDEGRLFIKYDVPVAEFNDSSTGTSRVDKTLSAVPPSSISLMRWGLAETGAATTGNILLIITAKSQTDTAPDINNYSLRIRGNDNSVSQADSLVWEEEVDSNRVICYRADTSAGVIFVNAVTLGYYL